MTGEGAWPSTDLVVFLLIHVMMSLVPKTWQCDFLNTIYTVQDHIRQRHDRCEVLELSSV
jgi:hypothetical protein